ncbi:hypothetical protein, partial [Escherichia coli]|uniref:hypothetical protein n=1 Tax=Escherichia coli TaxID=562 RepID=UPI0005306B1A
YGLIARLVSRVLYDQKCINTRVFFFGFLLIIIIFHRIKFFLATTQPVYLTGITWLEYTALIAPEIKSLDGLLLISTWNIYTSIQEYSSSEEDYKLFVKESAYFMRRSSSIFNAVRRMQKRTTVG